MRILIVLGVAVTASLVATAVAVSATGDPQSAAAGRTFHFRSPSGNIHCRMDAESVSCLLRKHSWRRLRPRPDDCDVDWFPTDVGMFFHGRSGRWRVEVGSCRGDVGPLCYAGDPCFVLRYGRSVTSVVSRNGRLGIRCTSTMKGITCRKVGRKPGPRGFRIAREGYVIL